ncbi:TolC family protein [Phenylobacterium sp.]|uniref:TolC family protein n=1 Tax=Phenylobacterium sp. TaxID=1871053 RepID=UPI002FCBC3DD
MSWTPFRAGAPSRRRASPCRLPAGLCLAVALAAGPVEAAPVTFAAALKLAEDQAPELQAGTLQVEAARSAARAAGALPDPKLQMSLENLPISGPDAGRLDAEAMTMARVGLMQELPNGAKRRAERDRAGIDVAAAQADRRAVSRDVRVAAAGAWIDLYYAQRRLRALDEAVSTLTPLWDAALAGVASGASRPAAAPEAQRLRADLEDRRSELVAEVASARARLARWTGDPQVEAAGAAPPLEFDAAALRAELERHPSLAALDAATRQAGAEVALARAGKRPDLGLELAYQRRDPMFGDMVSVGVTVSLPIFAKTRQDPIIAARVATAGQARARREAAGRALTSELEQGLADYAMRREQWLRARDTLLPLARTRADLETASYGAGRAGVVEVTEALTGRADAQLTLLEREAALARAAVRLTHAFGSDQ